eukprot:scaffold6691_cov358-Prasinococcus_capsulatus_cf.AAC.5
MHTCAKRTSNEDRITASCPGCKALWCKAYQVPVADAHEDLPIAFVVEAPQLLGVFGQLHAQSSDTCSSHRKLPQQARALQRGAPS